MMVPELNSGRLAPKPIPLSHLSPVDSSEALSIGICSPHFIDGETGAEKYSELPKMTQQGKAREMGLRIKADSKVSVFLLKVGSQTQGALHLRKASAGCLQRNGAFWSAAHKRK